MLFTDDVRQLRRAAKKLGITWDHSQAGVPRSNAIAEALGVRYVTLFVHAPFRPGYRRVSGLSLDHAYAF